MGVDGMRVATSLFVVVAAVVVYFELTPRVTLPDVCVGHEVNYFPQLLTEEQGTELRALIHEIGTFPTNIQDVRHYKALREHIGESQPTTVGPDGEKKCEHPLLVPDIAKENCVLPGRIDIGQHFLMYGGVEGLKEDYNTALARLQSFGVYNFDVNKYEIVTKLFETETFQSAAKSVCPPESQYLDPFQFNFIMQVPGQSVALHIDAPYFWGASRFQFPQWLLAAMVMSGKFKEHFIDQVQVVAYLHDWEYEASKAGSFVYWRNNQRHPEGIDPIPLSGSVVDGSKTVHAATVYRPDDLPPFMDKDRNNFLRHINGTDWVVAEDDRVLRKYDWDDLRISIVYRARCFADKEERDRYHATTDTNVMDLDTVLRTLAEELVARGKVDSVDAAMTMDRLDLSQIILKTFVTYPRPPKALIPYNYCALPKLVPATKYLLQWFC